MLVARIKAALAPIVEGIVAEDERTAYAVADIGVSADFEGVARGGRTVRSDQPSLTPA